MYYNFSICFKILILWLCEQRPNYVHQMDHLHVLSPVKVMLPMLPCDACVERPYDVTIGLLMFGLFLYFKLKCLH